MNEKDWRLRAADRGQMPVLQTHGRNEVIIPYSAAADLQNLFEEYRMAVEFLAHDRDHTIPAEGVERLASLLQRL